MSWTIERIEQLTLLWAQGVSAAGIAAILGSVTRSSVLGKANRLNLGEHPAYTKMVTNRLGARKQVPVNIRRGMRIRGPRTITPPELPKPRPEPPTYLGLTVLELGRGQCRYSHSDSSPYLFCGATSDGSWCSFHRELVYRKNAFITD